MADNQVQATVTIGEPAAPKAAQKGLGRGLSALIAENDYAAPAAVQTPTEINGKRVAIQLLSPQKMKPGSFQPRSYFNQEELKDLAESIKKNGVVQPVIVRSSKTAGEYEIIAGERRWRASQMALLNEVPAIVIELNDKQALEVALIENIQRQNLRPLEIASGYQRLIAEFSYTQEQLADVIGKSRSQITNFLRLLNLPDDVKRLVDEEKLSVGHARALIGAKNASELAQKIVRRGLNVRQTEKLLHNGNAPRKQRAKKAPIDEALQAIHRHIESHQNQGAQQAATAEGELPPVKLETPEEFRALREEINQEFPMLPTQRDPEIVELERVLSRNLGLDIQIHDQGEKGRVTIAYKTLDELDAILRRLERVAWLTPQ